MVTNTALEPLMPAFEVAPVGAWLLSRDGQLTRINNTARQYMDTTENLSFENWMKCIHNHDSEKLLRHWNDMWLHNHAFSETLRVRRPSGKYSWIEVRFQPTSNLDVWVCTAHSVSNFKQLEQQLNDQNLWLRAISHDLRQPLLAIDGYSTLIEETLSDPEQDAAAMQKLLARLRDNVARMRALVETGLGRNGQPELFSLSELSANIANSLKNQAPDVSINLPEEWPTIWAHRSTTDRILTNLLGNAIRYAAKSSDKKVLLEWRKDNGLVLCIHDSGPGVASDQHENIFKAHWREESSPGNGLGLTIVKNLVETQAGRIWVENSPLGGACFVVHLPVVFNQNNPQV